MDFSFFQPTIGQTISFLATIVFVVCVVLWIGRKAFPNTKVFFLVGAIGGWLILHAVVAPLEIFRSNSMPPPLVFYLFATLGVGIYFSFSKWGKQVALSTPISLLVFLQIFRFPLELVLASLAENGNVPVEMTFRGLNFDILTGIAAILILLLSRFKTLPDWVYWIWNIGGLGCLMVIGVVAPLSSPIPIRVFRDGPPLVLGMIAPWSWIVSVSVFFAVVGHLITFRLLLAQAKVQTGEINDA